MDRVSDSDSEGRWFESSRAYQKPAERQVFSSAYLITAVTIGMLMIPKTCAYVWTVLIGYKAMKEECGSAK